MKAFFARFSKAIGALGGAGIGTLLQVGFVLAGHPLPSTASAALPIVGSVIATVLAPPNSLALTTQKES